MFVCTVTDFSAAKKDGVKLRILVNFGLGAAGILSLLPGYTNRTWEKICGEARWAVGIWRRIVGYASCLQTHLLKSGIIRSSCR